jgi:hypothetical protein
METGWKRETTATHADAIGQTAARAADVFTETLKHAVQTASQNGIVNETDIKRSAEEIKRLVFWAYELGYQKAPVAWEAGFAAGKRVQQAVEAQQSSDRAEHIGTHETASVDASIAELKECGPDGCI